MDDKQATKVTGRGGARPGAGRKPTVNRALVEEAKAETQARLRDKSVAGLAREIEATEKQYEHVYTVAEIEIKVSRRLSRLLNLMMGLAEGVKVQETGKDGKPIVYTRLPDKDAIKYLMDRGMGRIAERLEMVTSQPGTAPEAVKSEAEHFDTFLTRLAAKIAELMQAGGEAAVPTLAALAAPDGGVEAGDGVEV